MGDLPLRNSAGTYVRLGKLADIYESSGCYQVLHQGARRVQTVTANVAGYDVASFVQEARQRIQSGTRGRRSVGVGTTYHSSAAQRSRRPLQRSIASYQWRYSAGGRNPVV